MAMESTILFSVLLILQFTAGHPNKPTPVEQTTIAIPPTAQTGLSNPQFAFHDEQIDAPELALVNSTSWEWWYYDIVGPDQISSFVLAFFSSLKSAYSLYPPGLESMNFREIWGIFPNGTVFANVIAADETIITLDEDRSSGSWVGSGVSWVGNGDGGSYIITFDSPEFGIKGTFSLKSVRASFIISSFLH